MSDDGLPDGYDAEQVEALRHRAKEELRRRFAGLRRALSATARAERSERACLSLRGLDAWRRARTIAGYAPLRFELDPRSALAAAADAGAVVALPRVVGTTITLHELCPGQALVRSAMRIDEPPAHAPAIDPAAVDVVLVPAIAYDVRGYRLGFGQGFYDRFLPECPRALKVGLCFELSLIAEVPDTRGDVPVDLIVTDRRVISCHDGAGGFGSPGRGDDGEDPHHR